MKCSDLQALIEIIQENLAAALKGWALCRSKLTSAVQELHTLKQKERRSQLKRKNDSCHSEKNLEKKFKSNATQTTVTKFRNSELSGILVELLNCHSAHKSAKYTEAVKEFSLNMHYYSAKAYDFLRKSVGNQLPHPRIFHSWTKFIDIRPGN